MPSDIEGLIAPGMSVFIFISFCAPSFGDFDDELTVVTEAMNFAIPIRARRDPPIINLVNPLDCRSCWLGDRVDMAFRCMNSGGDGGFKFFCEKDEDDKKQQEADSLKIGPFTLFPSEFYLYTGNAIDIFVSFNPKEEGTAEENLILACDNLTSEFYKLKGYGSMLDLEVVAVDGRPVDFKKNPFQTIFFENTNPTAETRRTLSIQNKSPILVSFHWSLYRSKSTNKIILNDEQTHYRLEPSQGKIQGGETQEFVLVFEPLHAEPYYEYADLIVEDIPINSMRDPPDALKAFAESSNAAKSRMPIPTYVGSNTQYLSIPLLHFNLRGQGNFCELEIDPPIVFFEEELFINSQQHKSITLKKKSDGNLRFRIRLEGKSSEHLQVALHSPNAQFVNNVMEIGRASCRERV